MKKNKVSILLVIILMFGNLLPLTIQAENLHDTEMEAIKYITEEPFTYDRKPENGSTSFNELRQEIKEGLLNLEEKINIEKYKRTVDNGEALMNMSSNIVAEHPEIYYISGYNYRTRGNIITEVLFRYSESDERIQELDAKIDHIIGSIITPSMNEFEKELAIHDYIVLNTSYEAVSSDSYRAYGVLIDGRGVCAGYAQAMQFLLNKVDIESIIVSSPEMNHAWNIVTIDGADYHVDATWNDPIPNREGYVQYQYFNVSDQQMEKTHQWNRKKYPTCTNDSYSFLWDVTGPKYVGKKMYYASNEASKEYIYELDLETFSKKQITSVRAPYFDLAGDWLYFSNYSHGAHLYKVKLDGSYLTPLNNQFSENIYFKDGSIYYTERDTGKERRIETGVVSKPIQPDGADDSIDIEPTIQENSQIKRLAGHSRVETSIAVSKEVYPDQSSKNVVLAGYHGEADALTGTLLASAKDAPILLAHQLNHSVKNELNRLGAETVYLIGGESLFNQQFVNDLKNNGYKVIRVAGMNRFETAIEVAKEAGYEKSDHVFLTNDGRSGSLADALAIGPVSGKKKSPILLTSKNKLPKQTLEALRKNEVKQVTIVGGAGAVSDQIVKELNTLDITVDRIAGTDRWATAKEIAAQYFDTSDNAIIANDGRSGSFADALMGGYLGAKEKMPILLTQAHQLNRPTKNYLLENISSSYILGGETVVNQRVVEDIGRKLKK